MKEPWKKSCNGKVVITLNNEKASAEGGAAATSGATEVEVPVDLAWATHHHSERRCSAPKGVILLGVLLVLGLTLVTLFKVQNLVYSTTYVNWRMQELESAVNDNNDDVKLIKYKLDEFILDEKNEELAELRGARAEPLVASLNSKNQLDSDDLRLSESQNQNHKLTNSLNSEKKPSETVGKNAVEVEQKEQHDMNSDSPNHPNPNDPEEWIKPLVETFDIFGGQPSEDQFIQNVLMKLLVPSENNNVEVLELNKMPQPNSAEGQQMMMRPSEDRLPNRPMPLPIESILMKSLMPPLSNFRVFHLNERLPESQQSNNMEEELPGKMSMRFKQMMPPAPFADIFKALLPPGNMKIFQLNDKLEQQQQNQQQEQQQQASSEEDMPKITIQSVKVRLVPIPEELRQDMGQPNVEVIRMNESPEPSQEVEAPKEVQAMPFNPFPFPIHEIMKSILPGGPRNIEIVPLTMNDKAEDQQQDGESQEQQERFNPLPIPLQDFVMKALMTEQQPPQQQQPQQQENSNEGNVEITKIPVRAIHPFPIPETLMKSMLPMSHYGGEPMHMINVPEQPQQPQQQSQQPQQQPQQQQQEEVRQRSTKLNPVEEDWNIMAPPAEPSAQH